MKASQAVRFSSVLYNEGGSYDPTSGQFTAPEDGTYLALVAVHVSANSPKTAGISAQLTRDALSVASVPSHHNAGLDSAAMQAVLKLRKGQKLSVINTADGTIWAGGAFSAVRV